MIDEMYPDSDEAIANLFEEDVPEPAAKEVETEGEDADVKSDEEGAENTESTTEDDDTEAESKTDDDPDIYEVEEDYRLKLGEKVYTVKELVSTQEKVSGLEKKMTQGLQKLAKDKGEFKNTVAWGKSLVDLKEALSNDSELLEKVKEAVEKTGDQKAINGLSKFLETDPNSVVDPYLEEKTALEKERADEKLEREYNNRKASLMSEYELDEETMTSVEDACLEAKENDDKYIDLEHMILKMMKDGRIEKGDPSDKKSVNTPGKKLPKTPKKLDKNKTGEDETRKKTKPRDIFEEDGVSDDDVKKYGSDIFSP